MNAKPRISRRALLLAGSAALLSTSGQLHAQATWPTPGQPIRIVVGQGAGAGSDVLARQVAHELQGALNHSVIVENRPGAAGTLAGDFVSKAAPDGHTLLLSSTSQLLVPPEIMTGIRMRYTDFTPVAGVNEVTYVLLVPNTPEGPKTFAQLRQQLASGRGTFGSSGPGSMAHLGSSLVLQRAGLKADHVAYRSTAQVAQDLAGARIGFTFDSMASARPLLQSGKLLALAVSGSQRMPSLPDVPTLAEAGLPNTVIVGRAGLLAPKGTPPQVVERLSNAVQKVVKDPQFVERLAQGETRAAYLSPADFAAEFEADAKLWIGLVKQLNIRAE